jgi:hypothetical protein
MRYNSGALLLALDLTGTFVFAVEGAGAAAVAHLDFLGLVVLSFATALGGGIIRDLLIGRRSSQFHPRLAQVPVPLLVGLDAAGLALFAVTERGRRLPLTSIHLLPSSWAESRESAAAPCAMSYSRKFPPFYAPIYTRSLLWPEPPQ